MIGVGRASKVILLTREYLKNTLELGVRLLYRELSSEHKKWICFIPQNLIASLKEGGGEEASRVDLDPVIQFGRRD